MKKIVVRSTFEDENGKRKALKVVAGVQGVDSLAVDAKDKKITVIGDVDPVFLTSKLRKIGFTELLSVGPAKEEKKEEKKPQNDPKKDKKSEVPQIVYVPSISDYNPPNYTVVREEHPPPPCTIL
ncbi:heavy metal-associated isoprenylated plant protein 39 [Cryptomeria japonica]|uniref:heavy metal-associated isoprenylated plant protein 39 n=1 Tax=Cryptomeria japonica TaxID=3369 RepID=UPI0025ACEF02|nr:heavy metal-associated isoprenylated plant protein 39 [Cryptomeria japonica]